MEIDIETIRNDYIGRLKKIEFLVDQIKYVLNEGIDREKIKIHSVIHRVKGFDSFLNKIIRKNSDDPFNEIHDLIGLRVICLFLSDIALIGEIIEKEFNVFEKDDQVHDGGEEISGYRSIHYKAKLKEVIDFPEYRDINHYPFEIQVRTIAQDAWASISQYLDYKRVSQWPAPLREEFHALSRLFYEADTQFADLQPKQSEFFLKKLADRE